MSAETELWNQVKKQLTNLIGELSVDSFFNLCEIYAITQESIVFYCSDEYKAEYIGSKYIDQLRGAVRAVVPPGKEVTVLSPQDKITYDQNKKGESKEQDKYTFERFVVGKSNQYAHAAALAVANNRTSEFNPLFIYGNSGLGKTHLLRAIRNKALQARPKTRIIYIKGDEFTNDLVASIQAGSQTVLRDKYRRADMLLMDDVQFIAGKQQTQEEFFHTFDALYEHGAQIVFTADRPPNEIMTLEDRLRSRFSSGLLADISKPDYETRLAIVKNIAADLAFPLPQNVAEYLAEHLTANIRQLEGAVRSVYALYGLVGAESLSIEEVEKRIRALVHDKEHQITAELIITQTAQFFSLEETELRGPLRHRSLSKGRHIAMYLIRKYTNLTMNEIGALFSGRDHSTVLNAVRNVENSIKKSPDYNKAIKDISANIENCAQ
ncbi:MAG: chromosomal replication initiator protein DnaA [Oscillospiraceae bacterium]|jgi:chromosomal replication initiator protein|nr:chromosomal replication initiator protein DnaA [Oscillospiraceae bacterium]